MYNIGIIGFGGMGHQHFLAVSSHPKARVKGVFDINPKRIEFAESLGLVTYPDAQAFFDDPEIDIVIVASTNDVHGEHSINAIMAGKHVICEKPATITSAELKEVMYVAEKHNKIFTINQNRRRDRDFLLMKESVEKGILGDIYDIQSRTHGSRGIPKGWRTTKSLGGGMMLDWGVHLIDQILHMTSEKVTNVFCKMYNIHYDTVDDNFKLILTFESGLTAQIEVGTNNLIPQPRWYVLGKEGTLQIDDWDCTGKIIRCTHKEDTWDEEIAPTKAGPSKTMSPRSANSTQTIEISSTMDWVQNKGLEAVYNQFFDAIEGSAELKITPEQALRVMKVIEAAFLSNETKTALEVSI